MRPRSDGQAGFMLVEVLAALVVTAALVAVVLPFAGRLIARWSTGQATLEEADGWMQMVARLSDDVAQARPLHVAGGGDALDFTLEPRRLSFVRPALAQGRPGALERVTYRIEAEPGGQRLVRHAGPVEDAATGGRGIALLSGPYTLAFAAVAASGARGPWTGMNTMPVRVELDATARQGGRVPFSPVTLPLVARANVREVIPLLRSTAPGP